MAPQKSVTFFFLINLCVALSVSLPWTYKQTGETGTVYDKLFPSDERAFQDSYGKYPWSRNDVTEPLIPESESQTEQSLQDREMKRNLLRELLDWENRRLDKGTESKVTNEKREPQRCTAGYFGSCGKRSRVLNKEMQDMDTKAGPSLRDENDINTFKEYDVAVERALQELEGEASRV